MLALELLAERRIEEAIARGEFDGLPGTGHPLELEDESLVPEDLRVAYRVLKNAGFVPQQAIRNYKRRGALLQSLLDLRGGNDAASASR